MEAEEEVSSTTATSGNGKDKTPIPTLLAKPRTPTSAVKSPTREHTRTSTVESGVVDIITVDGVRYARTPSSNFPPACSTKQITKNLMTSSQLEKWKLKPGDDVYMEKGAGRTNPKLNWWCGPSGQRIFK